MPDSRLGSTISNTNNNNVVAIGSAPAQNLQPDDPSETLQQSEIQEVIDDIGAKAFLFMRDASEEVGVPIKDVIVEHMKGLAMVMAAVEGEQEVLDVLATISQQLQAAEEG